MPARRQVVPPSVLFRLGRAPDPLAWPPRDLGGSSRFDDPNHEFAVLYAAAQRYACFVESLARFRPTVAELAGAARLIEIDQAERGPRRSGQISANWLASRRLATLALAPHQHWLDVRLPDVLQMLRVELAEHLHVLGYADFDLGEVLGRDRRVTQAIARWAFERHYRGIAYSSRFDAGLECWALFEGAEVTPVGRATPVTWNDLDVVAVMQLFGLTVVGS